LLLPRLRRARLPMMDTFVPALMPSLVAALEHSRTGGVPVRRSVIMPVRIRRRIFRA
jgi:hypothetical protein